MPCFRYSAVPLQDDDLLVLRSGVQSMLKAKQEHPDRIIGYFGR